MGLSKDSSVPDVRIDTGQGCVVIMIILTLLAGYFSAAASLDSFPFMVALGLSTIAASILYLASSLQTNKE